jgi:hypothetical protein
VRTIDIFKNNKNKNKNNAAVKMRTKLLTTSTTSTFAKVLASNLGCGHNLRCVVPITATTTATIYNSYFRRCRIRSYSTDYAHNTRRRDYTSVSSANNDDQREKDEQNDAWTVLAALEKAKEVQLVSVARLVSALETLLPITTTATVEIATKTATTSSTVVGDRKTSVFSLPDIAVRANIIVDGDKDAKGITGDDVRTLLQSAREGKIIDIRTVTHLIEGATKHFQTRHPHRLVTLPPLRDEQQLSVIGDLHGSLSDLATVLALQAGDEPHINNLLLFNGDLADRGDNGIEIISIVCSLCLAYPEFVFVNRGNHEDMALGVAYGLAAEVQQKYGSSSVFRKILKPILDAFFRSLPLATIIEDDALIVHAGPPSPDCGRLADILLNPILAGEGLSRSIINNEVTDSSTNNTDIYPNDEEDCNKRSRTGQEIIEALLWSDPIVDEDEGVLEDYRNIDNHSSNEKLGWVPNLSRGAGHKFDANVVRNRLRKEKLWRMIRSHEPVRQGCIRYEINNDDDISGVPLSTKPMELFTVFSASHYPYKEGFNQGAILELKANGKHGVIRYATEDDEPLGVMSDLTAFASFNEEESLSMEQFTINPNAIRRTLLEAVAHHRGTILDSLRQVAKKRNHSSERRTVPFDKVIDVLIETLQLDNEAGLKKIGAKKVLAKALQIEWHDAQITPINVDLEEISNALTTNQADDTATSPFHSCPWLYSVFEIIDLNHDGFISQTEWLRAIATINSELDGSHKIDAEHAWDLLDSNGDGRISISEWEKLGQTTDSELWQNMEPIETAQAWK